MKVSFNGVCRIEENVYVKVTVFDAPENTSFNLSAQSEKGDHVPCRIIPISSNNSTYELALIAPILNITFTLLLSATIDGKTEKIFSRRFNPVLTKWSSRFSHLLKRPITHTAAATDRSDAMECLEIDFHECIEHRRDMILCCDFFMANAENRNIEISVFDAKMKRIESTAFFIGDHKKGAIDRNLDSVRQWSCRIRIPHSLECFLILVTDADSGEDLGFYLIELPVLRHRIDLHYDKIRCACADGRYLEWFDRIKATRGELEAQRNITFDYAPKFSVIVPLYKTPLNFFDEMAASVLNQSYENLELILIDASPECEGLTQRVRDLEKADERVRVVFLEENLGITENTNAGIAVATGDFLSFFDHDDTLELNLFYEYTKALNEDPEIDLLYCDEDKLSEEGIVCEPVFKPDFNYDLLRTNNYICHLLTVRKSIVDTLSTPTKEFDGAQDYNMALRVIEKGRHVGHIDKVLYHWRKSATSTAGNVGQKNYADDAGALCVQEHLKRMNFNATSGTKGKDISFIYATKFEPQGNPLVSIVIPTSDHVDFLSRCLQSLFDNATYENFEIILVDNNSTDPKTTEYYQKIVSQHSCIKFVKFEGDFNFSKIVNFGVSQSAGEYVLLLNNDTELKSPDLIERMLGFAQREDVGAVGVKMLYADDTIQCSGIAVTAEGTPVLNRNIPTDDIGYLALIGVPQNISAVSGACLMVEKRIFDAVAGFSEDFPAAFNDIDFCMKVIDHDYVNVQCNDVELYHYGAATKESWTYEEQRLFTEQGRAAFNAKWATQRIEGDPYLNKNVDQSSDYLALPPFEKWPRNPLRP